MLELKNISFKREGKNILKDINLIIEENKFIAITGPNGSGKSTLAKIIMGIEKPDSGKIYFYGQEITKLSLNERANLGLAFAFQQPVKFKGITVYDLLKLASNSELTKKEACEILSTVGLCADVYINRELNNSLSGGELKRIELATVALRNSSLTIFDEPEAGIDLWSFNNLIQVFINLRNKIAGSTVIITHQERILDIADTIILLKEGKVEQIGSKEEILPNMLKETKCCFEGGTKNDCC